MNLQGYVNQQLNLQEHGGMSEIEIDPITQIIGNNVSVMKMQLYCSVRTGEKDSCEKDFR